MLIADPAQLDALAAAVAEGTFDAAARALHVTPSAISQRVKALETSVGRVLLTRSKPVRATPSGEAVLRLARQIQALSDDVRRELDETGPLAMPLAVNADSLATWLLPALAGVEGVVFDLHRSDQQRTADLLRQGLVMAAVTASDQPVPGCTVHRLGRMRYRPVASAAFVSTWFPAGVTPAALARAPAVIFDRDDDLQDAYLRRRSRARLDPPRHHIPGSHAFLDAVRLGLGWGMVPDLQRRAPDDGLVEFDPRRFVDVELFWQQWRMRSATLDRVAEAVRTAASVLA